jgi:hypothetical protein
MSLSQNCTANYQAITRRQVQPFWKTVAIFFTGQISYVPIAKNLSLGAI